MLIQEDEKEDISKDFDNQYLPIHYILSKGVRYIEMDVWVNKKKKNTTKS